MGDVSGDEPALVRVHINRSARDILALESEGCRLDTSDAADDPLCVDLGGRRIIKKKI